MVCRRLKANRPPPTTICCEEFVNASICTVTFPTQCENEEAAKSVSLRIGQSPGNSDEKKIPPEAVIWVTLMSAPPPPEGAVLCGSLWPGKGGIFESIMRSPVRQTHCVEAP